MANIDDLVFAVDETQKKYSSNTFSGIYSTIISGDKSGYSYITSTNGARNIVKNIPVDEIVKILASEIVRIYNYTEIVRRMDPDITSERDIEKKYNKIKTKCPYYDEVRDFVMDMKNPKVNSILYFLNDKANLIDVLTIIQKYHYDYNRKYRKILDYYGSGEKLPNFCETELIEKISSDYLKISGVKQVQVNQKAVNKCVADILSGAQIRNKNNLYQVGKNLFAAQNVGKKRKNQEDSVLIMEHPDNPDLKILVVSDGMGGGVAGEEVSNYTVKRISEWFQNINPEMYDNPEVLQQEFNHVINEISKIIHDKYNSDGNINAGATFTGAIVTREQTIITQIGDSRAYIVNNGGFLKKGKASLLTCDESMVWPRDSNNKPYSPSSLSNNEINDMRFLRGGNYIMRCIGDKTNKPNQSFRIPNKCYDKLLLMSDGASDLLSIEGIEIICRNTTWDRIAKTLVEAAISKKAVRGFEWNAFYEKLSNGTLTQQELQKYNEQARGQEDAKHMAEISAGKDNTTVAGIYRR